MKKLLNNIKSHLEAAEWDCEYNHPHKWNDKDMNHCCDILRTSKFPITTISELVDQWFDEILTEWYQRGADEEFAYVAADYIADPIAGIILSKRKTAVYPDSATFSILS